MCVGKKLRISFFFLLLLLQKKKKSMILNLLSPIIDSGLKQQQQKKEIECNKIIINHNFFFVSSLFMFAKLSIRILELDWSQKKSDYCFFERMKIESINVKDLCWKNFLEDNRSTSGHLDWLSYRKIIGNNRMKQQKRL